MYSEFLNLNIAFTDPAGTSSDSTQTDRVYLCFSNFIAVFGTIWKRYGAATYRAGISGLLPISEEILYTS